MVEPNERERDYKFIGLFLIAMSILCYTLYNGYVEAQPATLSLPDSVTLRLNEYIGDPDRQCYILWKRMDLDQSFDGHPVIPDWYYFYTFQVRDYRQDSIIDNMPHDVYVREDEWFSFCGYKIEVTYINCTAVYIEITER